MRLFNIFKRPLENQNGFAIIILISLISVTVISYSLYASNYFLILTHEVNQSKRVINGINVLQRVAQTLYQSRITHWKYQSNALINCAAQDPAYPQPLHELCVPDLTIKDDGLCIENPFLDPPFLCVRTAVNPTTHNILEVTGYEDPRWYDPYVKPLLRPIKKFNFAYGKTLVAMAENLSNRAVAYPDDPNALPALTGAPTLTKDPNTVKACGPGELPSEECIRCRDDGGPAAEDSRRPECFTLKVCLLPDDGVASGVAGDGFADCDPAINEQWIWQMVAVIHPVGP